ncbi:hypothetical protein DQG13_16995 [Paenibacillus sp. YN15]|nr:hypothetical protein DQG13_16995 [Paenibacillus sp. YN15]
MNDMFKIIEDEKETYVVNDILIESFIDKKFCVFDLEGTGLDFENDNIIQFGAVIVDNKEINNDIYFERFVKPSKLIPKKIENLTGITNKMVQYAGSFDEVFQEFQQFSNDCILVAQCGYEYDFRILSSECKRRNINYGNFMEMDTKILFAHLHPELHDTFSTDFLLNYYSIDVSGLKRHTALNDSIIIAHILVNILECCKNFAVE